MRFNADLSVVIPAKAGNAVTARSIHHPPLKFMSPEMDPRLSGGDEPFGGCGR
jgi:hypothetical protein